MFIQQNFDCALDEIGRLLRKRFEQRANRLGLTRAQWQTLWCLSCNEGVHQAALAETLEIGAIALVRILDKLEERGLVERRRHPEDRRVWLLFLSPEARDIVDAMKEMGVEAGVEALIGIEDEDKEHLFETLTRIKANLLHASHSDEA
ncbi:MarR family transcriptional regulator [Labrys miyagiensis]